MSIHSYMRVILPILPQTLLQTSKLIMTGKEAGTVADPGTSGVSDPDFAHAESNVKRPSGILHESVAPKTDESVNEDAMCSSSRPEDEDLCAWLKEQPKRVNVKWSDYEAFKNRFTFEDGLDIIEVLEGHPEQLRTEISHEWSRRQFQKHVGPRGKRPSEKDTKYIYRIRIQSAAILYVLGRLICQMDGGERPVIFMRPFQTFYHSFPFVKQVLKMLEPRINDESSIGTESSQQSERFPTLDAEDPLQTLSMPEEVDMEDIIYGLIDFKSGAENSFTAMEHLKLYVEFVERHIVPMWAEARGSSKYMVRFSDLPMYFRPGDALFIPSPAGNDKTKIGKPDSGAARQEGLAVHQSYWKLCYAQFCEPCSPKGSKGKKAGPPMPVFNYDFRVCAFHVDFDGDSYGPMRCYVNIVNYEGERDIRSLRVYPLRFNADATQTLDELTARAKNFLSHVRDRHLSYDGWTLIHETLAHGSTPNQKAIRVEHIEGEIMIDFKEGFQSDSGFVKPIFDLPVEPKWPNPTYFDPMMAFEQPPVVTQWWSDTKRSKKRGFFAESLLTREPSCDLQISHVKKRDKVFRDFVGRKMIFDLGTGNTQIFSQLSHGSASFLN